jgi:REP element-mobilizing transposase RayT
MSHNKAEIYLHFVWSTLDRHPLVTPKIERRLYRYITGICEKKQCGVLAIGGISNHIHLAVTLSTTVTVADLMQAVKGGSSYFARETLVPGEFFGWRDGYGVFSFSRSQYDQVVAYIRNQKTHHREGSLWHEFEMPEDDPTSLNPCWPAPVERPKAT